MTSEELKAKVRQIIWHLNWRTYGWNNKTKTLVNVPCYSGVNILYMENDALMLDIHIEEKITIGVYLRQTGVTDHNYQVDTAAEFFTLLQGIYSQSTTWENIPGYVSINVTYLRVRNGVIQK